jgi:pilus assembly protein CpaF
LFGKRSTSVAEGHSQVAEAPRPAPLAPMPTAQPAPEPGRTPFPSAGLGAPLIPAPEAASRTQGMHVRAQPVVTNADTRRSESYYEVKGTIFGALIEAIDLAQLARLDVEAAREEIRDIVNEIIAIKNVVMSISEQE